MMSRIERLDEIALVLENEGEFHSCYTRHHSQGCFEAERVFGTAITNSDGRIVPVRYIAEQHIKEDCGGRIPTVADWFRNIKPETWMSHGYAVKD